MKQRIENEFGDKIAFINIAYHEPQIVVSRSVLKDTCVSNFIKENKKFILKESARHLRSDITEMVSKAPELHQIFKIFSIMEPTKNDCLSLLKMFGKERQHLSEAELSILQGNVLV